MKTFILITTSFLILSIFESDSPIIEPKDLETTSNTLCKLTQQAITINRKDLVSIYYNAYNAIRSENSVPNQSSFDNYFHEIKERYGSEIGNWSLTMDFPPKSLSSQTINNTFSNYEIETLYKLRNLNISTEDLDQLQLLKGIQENTIDVKLLKNIDLNKLKELNINLNKLKVENINTTKLFELSNEKLKIEQLKEQIRNN